MLVVALTAGAVFSCATTPPTPEPYDPVGQYSFATQVEGFDVTGSMTIEREADGSFGGVVTPHWGEPPMPIISVHVLDQTITINIDNPEGVLVVVVTVAEDGTMTAAWSLGDQVGEATITKEPVR